VEQRNDNTEHGALMAELLRVRDLHFMTDDEPRRGERDVQRVLLVVIDGVDAEVPGHAPGEHALEVAEHVGESGEFLVRPDFGEQLFDSRTNVGSRAHENRVGYVVVAAAGFCDHVRALGVEH
jgi:hypothetical protein